MATWHVCVEWTVRPHMSTSPTSALHCFTGDDTGLLKRVRLSPQAKAGTLQRWGDQAAGGGVTSCCWGPGVTREQFVGAGYESGVVRFWDTSDESKAGAEAVIELAPSEDAAPVSGVHVAGDTESDARVISCDRLGCVRTWAWL